MKTWQVRVVKTQETLTEVLANDAIEAQQAAIRTTDWSTSTATDVKTYAVRLKSEPPTIELPNTLTAPKATRTRTRARSIVTDAGTDN